MPVLSATEDVTIVVEHAQPKINAIHSIILPFITTSFHFGTTAFWRPFERPNASFPNAAVNGQRCSQPPAILPAINRSRALLVRTRKLRKVNACRCPAVGPRVSLQD